MLISVVILANKKQILKTIPTQSLSNAKDWQAHQNNLKQKEINQNFEDIEEEQKKQPQAKAKAKTRSSFEEEEEPVEEVPQEREEEEEEQPVIKHKSKKPSHKKSSSKNGKKHPKKGGKKGDGYGYDDHVSFFPFIFTSKFSNFFFFN